MDYLQAINFDFGLGLAVGVLAGMLISTIQLRQATNNKDEA
jgi:hypothetical protein